MQLSYTNNNNSLNLTYKSSWMHIFLLDTKLWTVNLKVGFAIHVRSNTLLSHVVFAVTLILGGYVHNSRGNCPYYDLCLLYSFAFWINGDLSLCFVLPGVLTIKIRMTMADCEWRFPLVRLLVWNQKLGTSESGRRRYTAQGVLSYLVWFINVLCNTSLK